VSRIVFQSCAGRNVVFGASGHCGFVEFIDLILICCHEPPMNSRWIGLPLLYPEERPFAITKSPQIRMTVFALIRHEEFDIQRLQGRLIEGQRTFDIADSQNHVVKHCSLLQITRASTGLLTMHGSASVTSSARSRCLPGLRVRARALNLPSAWRPRTTPPPCCPVAPPTAISFVHWATCLSFALESAFVLQSIEVPLLLERGLQVAQHGRAGWFRRSSSRTRSPSRPQDGRHRRTGRGTLYR